MLLIYQSKISSLKSTLKIVRIALHPKKPTLSSERR